MFFMPETNGKLHTGLSITPIKLSRHCVCVCVCVCGGGGGGGGVSHEFIIMHNKESVT